MTRKTKSIRGEEIDFDLLELKSQIGKKQPSVEVNKRENFIFSRRRRGKKVVDRLASASKKANSSGVEDIKSEPVVETPSPTATIVDKNVATKRIVKK